MLLKLLVSHRKSEVVNGDTRLFCLLSVDCASYFPPQSLLRVWPEPKFLHDVGHDLVLMGSVKAQLGNYIKFVLKRPTEQRSLVEPT